MSVSSDSVTGGGKLTYRYERVRILTVMYPEWRTWLLSLLAWAVLLGTLLTTPGDAMQHNPVMYCVPPETAQALSAYGAKNIPGEGISSGMFNAISSGMGPWVLMIAAMMFPLLNEPVRHVAFSIRRKDTGGGIAAFLAGYTAVWMAVGMLFLLLPFFTNAVAGSSTPLVKGVIKATGFLLAAGLLWLPGRLSTMTKCSQTSPIRIGGWHLYADSFGYGCKTGVACLNMCWAPMAALMLAHHNIALMYIATVILIYERYLLPHTSKLPAYAWGITGLLLLGIEVWA